jgi:hypothetical protein
MTDIWEPADAEEALAVALLSEYGLGRLPQYAGQNPIDTSLTEAVDAMRPSAKEIISSLVEDGYTITKQKR